MSTKADLKKGIKQRDADLMRHGTNLENIHHALGKHRYLGPPHGGSILEAVRRLVERERKQAAEIERLQAEHQQLVALVREYRKRQKQKSQPTKTSVEVWARDIRLEDLESQLDAMVGEKG